MADAKEPTLPEVAVEDAIPVLEEWKEYPPLSIQLSINSILKSHAAQAARIKELEAERDSWRDDDLNGRVAYDTLREERDTLKARCEALEAACRRQVENIQRWLETGEPAGPDESKSIYDQLKAALRAAGE